MACDRFTRELKDHALGAALQPAAAAHLATCSRCQERFARETTLVAAIDGAVGHVGRVVPAADYRVRLREAANRRTEPVRGRWRMAGAAVMAVVLFVVAARASRPWWRPSDSPGPSAGAMLKNMGSSVATAPKPPATVQPVRASARAQLRSSDVQVLVPAGQPQLIARLLVSLQGREPTVASQMVGRAVTPADPAIAAGADVIVAPIRIEAVTVPELVAPEPLRTN
jgi:hypothetical protein